MHEGPRWCDWLKEYLLGNPAERERVAREMGVNSLTVVRWANGTSTPPRCSPHFRVDLA